MQYFILFLLTFCTYREQSYFYPALTGSKTPPQNSWEAKKLGGGRAARKSPIGSTNSYESIAIKLAFTHVKNRIFDN